MPITSAALEKFMGARRSPHTRRRQSQSLCGSIEALETRVLLSAVSSPPAEVAAAATNTPPITNSPFFDVAVNENAPDSVFDLSTIFSDAEDSELAFRVELHNNPGLVTATISGATLTLDYAANQSGGAFIVIRATDSGGLFAESAFLVTVTSNNDAPTVANPVGDVTVDEDADGTVIDLSGVFADAEDQELTLSVQSNTNGELVDATLEGTVLTLNYAANQSGTAEITLLATDSGGKTVETTFLVTVNAVNDVPTVVNPINDVTVDENADNTLIDLSSVFSDVEDGELILSVYSNTNGELVDASLDGTMLTLDYADDHSGNAGVTIRATDSNGDFVDTTFQVTVNEVEDDGDDRRNDRREILLNRLQRLFSLLRNRGRARFFWGFGWRLR